MKYVVGAIILALLTFLPLHYFFTSNQGFNAAVSAVEEQYHSQPQTVPLHWFASLCATRSFRRSAESLGISQASVSNQMKALEEQLGVLLFARRPGQRPTLTPEGMAFLDDLRAFPAAGSGVAFAGRATPEDLVRSGRAQVQPV